MSKEKVFAEEPELSAEENERVLIAVAAIVEILDNDNQEASAKLPRLWQRLSLNAKKAVIKIFAAFRIQTRTENAH